MNVSKALFMLFVVLCCDTATAIEPKSHWEVRYYRESDCNYITEDDFRTCVYGRIDAIKRANLRRAGKGIHAVQVFRVIRVKGFDYPAEWIDIEYDIAPERIRGE